MWFRTIRTKWTAMVPVVAVASFAVGLSTGHYRHWPWQDVVNVKEYITWKSGGLLQRQWPAERSFAAVDFDRIIQVRNAAAVDAKRSQLRDYIWRRDQGAQRTRAKVVVPPSVEALSRLGKAIGAPDLSLVVDGPYGYGGEAFVWFAKAKVDCLFIYIQGHGDELLASYGGNERWLLQTVLNRGCDVLAVAMPLLGVKQERLTADTSFGPLVANTHNDLTYLATDDYNPLSLFFVHIRAAIDALEGMRRYARITMAGLSGGGWTTTVYAAIDPRIDASIAVAGSLPLMFRVIDSRNQGDWEQTDPGLLRIADYLDLYVLGAAGGRRVELVYNYYDSCCFGGNAALAFRPALAAAAKRVKGQIDLTIDDTYFGHHMSPATVERIASLAVGGPARNPHHRPPQEVGPATALSVR